MSKDENKELSEEEVSELLPVKGKVLGEYSIRVSHSVAEQLRKHPELLQTFIAAIEQDIKDNPELHPDFIKKNMDKEKKEEDD